MTVSRLAALGLLVLGMGVIEWLRRKHEREIRPSYREDIDRWDSDLPHIERLKLPPIKALKATKARRGMEIVAGRHAVAARGVDR